VYLSANATQSILSRITGDLNGSDTPMETLTDRELDLKQAYHAGRRGAWKNFRKFEGEFLHADMPRC